MPVRTLKDPTTWVNDQIAGVRAGLDKYRDGVLNPSRDPKAAMKAATGRWKDSVQKAISDNTFEKSIDKIDFDEAAALAAASADQLAAGVEKRRPKLERKIGRLHPLLLEHTRKMQAMPVTSDADADKKMIANVAGMREIGKRLRS